MSLARRAQLAVVAHIRHTYTPYDYLLKAVNLNWNEARRLVENRTLDRLVSWRGDGDEDTSAMQDIIREVIVISDDDDEVDSNKDNDGMLIHEQMTRNSRNENNCQSRSELQTFAPAIPINSVLGRGVPYVDIDRARLSSGRHPQHDQRKIERNETLWHRAWEDALARRKKNPEILQDPSSRLGFREPDAMDHGTIADYQSQKENFHSSSNMVLMEPTQTKSRGIKARPIRQVSMIFASLRMSQVTGISRNFLNELRMSRFGFQVEFWTKTLI